MAGGKKHKLWVKFVDLLGHSVEGKETAADAVPLRLEHLEPRVLLDALTSSEQLFIYLLNRARSDPQAYETEAELSVSLAGVEAQPPLAVNDLLCDSALFHAQEMADFDYFDHQSEVTLDWPNKMAIDAGYPLPWGPDGNQIESLAAGFGNPDPPEIAPTDAPKALQMLIEDLDVVPPGHRQHLLAMNSFWQEHREIGVGWAFNSSSWYRNYWTIHTAYENTSDLFLTGVVFDDKNDNQQFDLNEGLSGVTVSADPGPNTLTNNAGGWSLPVTAGTYIVSAAGGSFDGTGSSMVIVDDSNVEIDFISDQAAGIVDFGLDTGSSLPSVSIAATDAAAAEQGTETATFTFTRTGDTDEALTVNYSVGGTANSGSDFNALGGSVIIPIDSASVAVTLTPIDDGDVEGQETVVLTVLAGLDYQFGDTISDTATIADDEGALVTLNNKSVTYTEPDNTIGTITAKSADAVVTFMGNDLVIQEGSKSFTVTGPGGATVADITLSNTGGKTSLAFKASGGDGLIDVEDVNINGSAKDIKGKLVNLTGDLAVTGSLTKLEFHNVAEQHIFSIGTGATTTAAVSIKLYDVEDLSINSNTAIKSLTVNDWQDNDATADVISAPWVKKITVKQDFAAGLNLTDSSVKHTLGAVKVKGAINGGTWNVDGSGSKVSANSIAHNWSAVFSGSLAGLSTKLNAAGDLTAQSVKSISVKGNYANANLTLTQPVEPENPKAKALSKLTVKGTMDTVNIRSDGNIGNVTVGLLLDSNIFAGVNDAVTGLPTASTDLDATATIANFKLKGSKTETVWMRNSNLVAANVTKAAFGFADTDNSGADFGLATTGFSSITYKDATGNLKARSLEDVADFTGLGDMVLRILE